MEIRALAERLLFGDTLADKLWFPGELADTAPGSAIAVPAAPGRPAGLGLRRGRVALPSESELHREEARGRLLHAFANHELLAIELMALALLRFPDAPPAFRRGLARIVSEEQRHLRLYMDRMGLALGDLPVSAFFWDTLSPVASPLQFVAAMSLTLEQANLDFASHFATVFRRLGDDVTAAVLDVVLEDEIGHVRHGLAWFDRWRDPALSRWDGWVAALVPPLTPVRARGIGYCREARVRAGLDAEMIDALEVAGASRGRPPDVYLFNPEAEAEVRGLAPTRPGRLIAEDLGVLPVFLAGRDDVVVVARRPSRAWLADLLVAGFEIPELVDSPPDRRLGALRPWGWSPAVAARLGARWDPRWEALYSKAWSAARLAEWVAEPVAERVAGHREPHVCGPEVVGVACGTLAAARSRDPGVVKAPWSTAGRGLRVGADDAWVESVLREQGEVVVEPWLDRVLDLSLQFTVATGGGVTIDGWGVFRTDARGRYLGAVLGRRTDGLPPDVTRFLHGDGAEANRVVRTLVGMAEFLAPKMAALGFSGPAGLDALVYRDADGLRLKPLVEINPRVTMGRIALALERRILRGRVGLWVHPTVRALRRAGWASAAEFATALRGRAPLRVVRDPPLIDAGALFTSDPVGARMMCSVLVVAPTLAECEAVVARCAEPP